MRLRIHRGAHEIGGNCVEMESQGCSILLDLGLPLTARAPDLSLLPDIAGLTDGSNPHLVGIILSHTHGDHVGLTGLVHSKIAVFMGAQAQSVLLASRPFLRQAPLPETIRNYRNQQPFDLGPFRITAFLMDHSAFDAYSLLIEADRKRVFYSGDLRAHGRKARLFESFMRRPPEAIDVLLLEGTTLSRPERTQRPETEYELERRILSMIKAAPGLVLAVLSPQNIDRFVTVFRATRRAGRTFIADVYLAHVLERLNLPSLPRPAEGGMRVYLPVAQKRKVVSEQPFDLVSRYRAARIYSEEIGAAPQKWVMLFRNSMMGDIDRLPLHAAPTLIYSLWPGYLDRDSGRLRTWCRQHDIALEIAHTSGHGDQQSLVRLAHSLSARIVLPIHTEAPEVMHSLIPNVRRLQDGEWLAV